MKYVYMLLLGMMFLPQEAISQYSVSLVNKDMGIRELVVDNSGTLWMIEGAYDLKSWDGNKWESYPDYSVSSITCDEYGTLWIATGSHVYHWDGSAFVQAVSKPVTFVNVLCVNKTNIYLFVRGTGVYVWNGDSWTLYTTEDGLISDYIISGAVDSSGVIWIGTDSGLSEFDGTTWTNHTIETGLLGNTIGALYIDSNDDLWCGNFNGVHEGGLSFYKDGYWENFQDFIEVSDFSSCFGIQYITEDNSGILWFSHWYGVGRKQNHTLSDLRFHEHIDFPEMHTNAVASDTKGNIWCGTEEGLYKVTPSETSVESPESGPLSFDLSCFPNPFNPATTITYTLPSASGVTLAVFNLSGQNVATLIDGQQAAGAYTAVLDGAGLASGMYFARLEAGGIVRTEKMMLVK